MSRQESLSHTGKQLLLSKLAFMARDAKGKKKQGVDKDIAAIINSPQFFALIEDIRKNFDSKYYTPVAQETVVLRLVDLGVKDEIILAKAAEQLVLRKFTSANMITNIIYALGKLGFKPKDNEMWLATAID